jgi:hypothetical protein
MQAEREGGEVEYWVYGKYWVRQEQCMPTLYPTDMKMTEHSSTQAVSVMLHTRTP